MLWLVLIFLISASLQIVFLWISAHFAYKIPLSFKTFKRSFIQWITLAIIQAIAFIVMIILLAIGIISIT